MRGTKTENWASGGGAAGDFSEIRPAPTRAVMIAIVMFAIGANWTYSTSDRRKKFCVSAQSNRSLRRRSRGSWDVGAGGPDQMVTANSASAGAPQNLRPAPTRALTM